MNEAVCKQEPRLTLGQLLEDQKYISQMLGELVDFANKTVSNIAGPADYPEPMKMTEEEGYTPIMNQMRDVNYKNEHLLGCLTNIIHKIAE